VALPELARPDDHTSVHELGGDVSLVIHGHGEFAGAAAPAVLHPDGYEVHLTT
jgi:hypothetical protein